MRQHNGSDAGSAIWQEGIEIDGGLRYQVSMRRDAPPDTLIRDAFQLLERRIRSATGAPAHVHGVDLINEAFLPNSGTLQPVADVPAEQSGFYELFLGTVRLFQAPSSHSGARPLAHDMLPLVLHLVNHLLLLVDQAVASAVQLERYLGRHEGIPRYRRDFRLDIDADEEVEIVSLVDVGKVCDLDGQCVSGKLLVVVLDKVDGILRRIPVETIYSTTMDPAFGCGTKQVTNSDRQDLVVSWGAGETNGQHYIFRWDGSGYVLVKRHLGRASKYVSDEASAFVTHHLYQSLQFLDIDGDGLDEVIERDTLFEGVDTFQSAGFSEEFEFKHGTASISRVWKWDQDKSELTLVDLVVT